MHKFIEARDITLSCFVKAESKIDFIKRVNDFAHLFDKKERIALSLTCIR